MKFKSALLLTSAAVVLTAGMAAANPIDDAKITLGYDNISDGPNTDDGTWVRADTTVKAGGFETDLGMAYGDLGSGSAAMSFTVAPKMELGNGLKAGAFYDYTAYNDVADTEANHYGVTAEFDAGDMGFKGYFGTGENAGVDTNIYGVSANYDLAGAFDTGVFYNAEEDDVNETTEIGFSLGYEMAFASLPVYANATFAKVEDNGAKSDRIGITMSIPLGQSGKATKGAARPTRSLRSQAAFVTAN